MYFYKVSTAETGYNDMGLYDTSPVESDILLPIKSLLLIITLSSSVRAALVHNYTKYSVQFMTL